jgi:hypothetical protein
VGSVGSAHAATLAAVSLVAQGNAAGALRPIARLPLSQIGDVRARAIALRPDGTLAVGAERFSYSLTAGGEQQQVVQTFCYVAAADAWTHEPTS